MLPEVATFAARAGTARYQLDELLAVLGEADYERRAILGEWTVREVVAHVTAADRALADLLSVAKAPGPPRNTDSRARHDGPSGSPSRRLLAYPGQ